LKTEAKEGIVASGSTWANMHGLSKSDNLKGLQTYCILLIKLLERASKIKYKANETIIDDANSSLTEAD
jgi:hypothetical protein